GPDRSQRVAAGPDELSRWPCRRRAAGGEPLDGMAALYDPLLALTPSAVVRLNRAVAVRQVAGLRAALEEIEALAPALDGYHLFHAIRGELPVELGRREQARAAELRALALTGNRAERSLLEQRLILLEDSGGRPAAPPAGRNAAFGDDVPSRSGYLARARGSPRPGGSR